MEVQVVPVTRFQLGGSRRAGLMEPPFLFGLFPPGDGVRLRPGHGSMSAGAKHRTDRFVADPPLAASRRGTQERGA